ncbi:MAG: hypothetical protein IJ220_06035 [Clostridia bacterium]|nr:hypothetical protein [Clostridia bacterium]
MQVNEEKRKKFMDYAGKRVNNVLHDIQILEPMSRSNSYDFTKQDVDEMFNAMQETLNNTRAEFERKFEEKARSEKKIFSFGNTTTTSEAPISSTTTNEAWNEENSVVTTETQATTNTTSSESETF